MILPVQARTDEDLSKTHRLQVACVFLHACIPGGGVHSDSNLHKGPRVLGSVEELAEW